MGTEDFDESTERIIGCAIKVSRFLGPGFLEKVYENALVIELQHANLFLEQQKLLDVFYDSQVVGHYYADISLNELCYLNLRLCVPSKKLTKPKY